jgi:hypothetical protein
MIPSGAHVAGCKAVFKDSGTRVTCLDCPTETAIIFTQAEFDAWRDVHKNHDYSLRLEKE